MAFLRTHSVNLYIMGDVYSALQKDVRRGHVEQTLFWGGEFMANGNPNPLWDRLFLIASEDIGTGQPKTSIVLWNYYTQWKAKLKSQGYTQKTLKHGIQSKEANRYVIDALKYVANTYKNRIINNSLGYVTLTYQIDDIILADLPVQKLVTSSKYQNQINYLYNLWKFYLDTGDYERAVVCGDIIQQIQTTEKVSLSPNPFDYLCLYNHRDQLKQLFQTFRLINGEKFGNSRLMLTFMIYLIVNYEVVKDIIDDDNDQGHGSNIDEEILDEYYYHDSPEITERRMFAIPDYAIDKHTERGKGSIKMKNNFYRLEEESIKRGVETADWDEDEKLKSHGPFRKFADQFITQDQLESCVSNFFTVGSLVTRVRDGPVGVDTYFNKALKKYLLLEYEKGYKQAKSSQMMQTRWPSILKFLKKEQETPAEPVNTNIPSTKLTIPMKPSSTKLTIPMKPSSTKLAIPMKPSSTKLTIPMKPSSTKLTIPLTKKSIIMKIPIISNIDNQYLDGLNIEVLKELKILANRCLHYKDNHNKIYNNLTGKCVTISGSIGQRIVKDIIDKYGLMTSDTIVDTKAELDAPDEAELDAPDEAELDGPDEAEVDNQLGVFDRESQRFEFIVRAQLVTSAHKMDTYYAKDRLQHNKVVFVKGPYTSPDVAQVAIISMNLKRLLGLNYVAIELAMLEPDLLKSALSLRNKFTDLSIKRAFLIFDNLCDEKLVTIVRTSKLWPSTQVVDWDQMKSCHVFNILESSNYDLNRQYIEAIIYRWIVGAGDLADRNFMETPNKVTSVDEDVLGKPVNIATNLKIKRCQKIDNFIKNDFQYFDDLIARWKVIIATPEFLKACQPYQNFIHNNINNIDLATLFKC
jgi:hypothetical protein